jgi:hypothetical protein
MIITTKFNKEHEGMGIGEGRFGIGEAIFDI